MSLCGKKCKLISCNSDILGLTPNLGKEHQEILETSQLDWHPNSIPSLAQLLQNILLIKLKKKYRRVNNKKPHKHPKQHTL